MIVSKLFPLTLLGPQGFNTASSSLHRGIDHEIDENNGATLKGHHCKLARIRRRGLLLAKCLAQCCHRTSPGCHLACAPRALTDTESTIGGPRGLLAFDLLPGVSISRRSARLGPPRATGRGWCVNMSSDVPRRDALSDSDIRRQIRQTRRKICAEAARCECLDGGRESEIGSGEERRGWVMRSLSRF